MKRKFFLIACIALSAIKMEAQVGVGTSSPKGALDIQSTNSGILIPRIALNSLNIASPVLNPNTNTYVLETGTLIFNTNTTLGQGFYYWNGSNWVSIQGGESSTDKNTLDKAYDQGGPGLGRAIIADAGAVNITNNNNNDSGLHILNNSNLPGVAGQTTQIVKSDQIGVSSITGSSATGVNFYGDDSSTTNPYSVIQVTGKSNSSTYAVIKSTSSSTGDAIRATNSSSGIALRAENSSTGGAIYAYSKGSSPTANIIGNTAVPNVLNVENQRTDGGAGINTQGAIGIRALSSVNSGSGVSSYFTSTSGASGNFNGTGSIPVSIRSLSTSPIRAGIGAKGNSVGSYGEFTLGVGSAFSGYSSYYLDVYNYYCAVFNSTHYDVYRTTNQSFYYANVIGSGSNVTTINHDNKTHIMPAISAPQDLFQDFGTGTLVNGRVSIKLDPILSSNILVDKDNPIKIFIQLEGECNGVYVTNKSELGFDVIELNRGTSNTTFSYSISATRKQQQLKSTNNTNNTIDYSKRFRIFDNKPQTLLLSDNIEIKEQNDTVKPMENKILHTQPNIKKDN